MVFSEDNEGDIKEKKPKASLSPTNIKEGFVTNQNQQGFLRPKKGPKPNAAKGQANFKQQQPNKNAKWPNFSKYYCIVIYYASFFAITYVH